MDGLDNLCMKGRCSRIELKTNEELAERRTAELFIRSDALLINKEKATELTRVTYVM